MDCFLKLSIAQGARIGKRLFTLRWMLKVDLMRVFKFIWR